MGVLIVGIVVRVPAPSTAAATSASTAPRLLLRFRLLLLLHPLVLRPSVLEPYLHLQRSEIGFPSVRLQFYELQNKFNNRTTTPSQSKIARVSLTFHWLFHLEFHLSKINRDIDETILETSYETQDYDEIDKLIFLSETRRAEEKRKERGSKTKIIRSEQITSKA